MDLVAQLLPQVMGDAPALVALATHARADWATCRADGLVNRENDVRNARLVERTSWKVAAARSSHTADQAAAAKFGKELLEVRERNLLALGDIRQAHRRAATMAGKIDHR